MIKLPPTPRNIEKLPKDSRGYPIPFFVQYIKGEPDFRVMDTNRMKEAVNNSLCWICGRKLHNASSFNFGTISAITRISREPPSHPACAEFAVKACPFLTIPSAKRREANLPDVKEQAGLHIKRNPSVACVWTVKDYNIEVRPEGLLFHAGEPLQVTFWKEGRRATRQEVEDSTLSGIEAMKQEFKGIDALSMIREEEAIKTALTIAKEYWPKE